MWDIKQISYWDWVPVLLLKLLITNKKTTLTFEKGIEIEKKTEEKCKWKTVQKETEFSW